jgi:hypothetical protein
MRINDELCEELRRLYAEHEDLQINVDEARETLSRIAALVEPFAQWIAEEKVAGRVVDAERHSDDPLPKG